MIDIAGKDSGGKYLWNAVCDCGVKKPVRQKDVLRGKIISCGCASREAVTKRNTTHGGCPRDERWQHPLYATWRNIMTRSFDSTSKAYLKYGAVGKGCHEPWKDFAAFRDYIDSELGPKPTPKHSLDRILGEQGYFPGNVRWNTPSGQARNRSSCHYLTHDGITMTMTEWSEKTGIPYGALQTRLKHLGWTVERALTTPVMKNVRRDTKPVVDAQWVNGLLSMS